MASVACVIFDLGKVLVDWDLSNDIWTELKKYFGPPGARTEVGLKWERLYDLYACGKIAPRFFHQELMSLIGMQMSFDDFVMHWCNVFHPLDGMELLFKEVSMRLPVGLLSDTDPLHWAYILETYPWIKGIKNPTLSFETGALKPDSQAYLRAASNTGFAPQECFFTDDLEKNVQGAIVCGMDGVHFKGSEALREELIKRRILMF